ncbi:MAG TPA: NAD(P) transhydrogenase subunit alpha [Gammaproteobacteria bacterium]|nr:NAD(P) transhydrogenase subunit alpha [Gammaproteobacteria bacterium]
MSDSITLLIPRETAPGERRVALVPALAARFAALGAKPMLQAGAGAAAGIPDGAYADVEIVTDARLASPGLVLCVQPPPVDMLAALPRGSVIVGLLQPFQGAEKLAALRDAGVTAFAMELVPRISRAQSMDARSSQDACAGYKAALIAAAELDRFLPMLTTAAGTIRPARVLVIGAGVAGLQAIATARRLGAQVEAFDVRAATREQVESLGAKFVDTGVRAEGEGGYARELTDEERQQQQDVLAKHVALADAVITTAAVPGRPAPKLITRAMLENMKHGAVIVDLAAETGGNCELTRAGETVTHAAVRIIGPVNLPSRIAEHASEMYCRNLLNFITPWFTDGALAIDWNDEVYAKSVLVRDGEVAFEPARKLLS